MGDKIRWLVCKGNLNAANDTNHKKKFVMLVLFVDVRAAKQVFRTLSEIQGRYESRPGIQPPLFTPFHLKKKPSANLQAAFCVDWPIR